MIKTFIVYNELEQDRKQLVANLQACFSHHQVVKAIYPSETPVPFISTIQKLSQERTGKALSWGEIGCLLTHRKIWQAIVNDKEQASIGQSPKAYLIVESDSVVNNKTLIESQFDSIHQQYDLFFWGAFEGRVQLFRSTQKNMQSTAVASEIGNSNDNSNGNAKTSYVYGTPFIKSLYCTYGYSLNKNAAAYLLSVTKTFSHPVDVWKKNLAKSNLKVGAIKPELIAVQSGMVSRIQDSKPAILKEWILYLLVEIKNRLIVFFK
jgi:GR25 family glycosyltransferase involved in LPS biosynthesis